MTTVHNCLQLICNTAKLLANPDDVRQFIEACEFSAEKHKEQTRKNKTHDAYIVHPLHVAEILSACGVNRVDVLIAAVLHDTIEDTQTTKKELEQRFGSDITKYVMECTDDKSLPKTERKKQQIIHGSQISDEAKLIKLADKYSNLFSVVNDPPASWNEDRKRGYAVWSYAVCKNILMCSDRNIINNNLEALLDNIFSNYELTEANLDSQLEAYYKLIDDAEEKKETTRSSYV